ncbi:MAG: CHAT domain-containing protein [Bacteroidetes bacterium]|nr:CHAT domain-containing protein [Bacteroidota bacterium]
MRKFGLRIFDSSWAYAFLLSLVAPIVCAQDWQTIYKQALAQYQAEDYQKSISLAEEALEKSKTQGLANRAYTLQLITTNCIMLNDADKGLKYVNEEIDLFKQAEGQKSKSLAEAMKKQILFLQQKGLIKQALEKWELAIKSFEESYGGDALQTLFFISLKGELTLTSGDSATAKKTWEDCLAKLTSKGETQEDYKLLLFNSAALDENLKDYPSAEKKYTSLITLLEKENRTGEENYKDAKEAVARLKNFHSTVPSSNGELESMLKKAISLQSNHQTDKALEVYKQAEEIAAKNSSKDKTAFSIYLNNARLQLNAGNLNGASLSLQKAKAAGSVLFKPTDFESFLVDLSDADILLANNQNEIAVGKYKLLSSRLTNEIVSRSAAYVLSSSSLLLNGNLPRPAVKLLQPLLCCLSQGGTVNEPFTSVVLAYCDGLLVLNQPDSALQFLNQPSLVSQPNLSFELKRIEALQTKGQWTQALEHLKKAETLATTDQLKGDLALQTARLAHQMGDYTKAEGDYQKAIRLYSQSNQENAWQAGNSLAILYSKLGNYDKSERMINELLSKVPEAHPLHSTLLENLAANYIETNQIEKAKSIQEKIISTERQSLGENHPDYALALTNMAVLYQKEKKYQEAKKLQEKALLISKNNFGDQSVDYALKESNLGAILKDIGDFENAKTSLMHSEKTLAAKIGKSHPDYVQCEYNLALVLQRLGDTSHATPLMLHLSEFYKKQTLELFPAMSEQEQVAFYNKINRPVQDFQQFAIEWGSSSPEMIGQLFDFRLATKALLLNSSLTIRELILSGGDQKLKEQFLQWLALKDQLGKLYSVGISNPQLESQANDLEKTLSAKSNLFKRGNEERAVNWKKIQAHLKPGEAAVELIRVKASGRSDSISYAALVIRKDSDKPISVLFRNGKKMEGREFSFYKNNIIHLQENDRSYRIYWKAIEPTLKDIQTIYFSSDGIYNKINLSTLFDPVKQEFLNSRYKVILVSNLRDLLADTSGPEQSVKTAQLFGPIYFGDTKTSSVRTVLNSILSRKMPELPGTKTEIEKIDQILKSATWSSSVHTEGQASERNLKGLHGSTLIHIATHGFFIESMDDDKRVVMSSTGEYENPLLLSGLVFSDVANPSDQNNDGLLTAYEVKNLNFSGTDLVTLSACETGSGEIMNGEGVYGLQRAFLLSGVKNILMSLWKVDDLATQELMVLFYQKILSGQSKTDALRSAQSELMKKYAEPYFWGSFVLIGKP